MEASRLRREVEELRHLAFDEAELIGNAPAMIRVRQAIERVAPTGSRIMISGPPGSGKEMAARLIHAKSRRASGPFVILNAALAAPEKVDIELFGAEPGHLGSDQPRLIGLLERADGGTLLIDQVADMPLELQGKILRVLQEQRFSRLGSDARIEVDVRVIASTNRDLKAEMAPESSARTCSTASTSSRCAMPPLAERRIDIPDLARHFMAGAARHSGLPPRPITDEAMAVLQTAEWAGDVRQLRNAIEWMLIMAPGEPASAVTMEGLPPELTNSATSGMDPNANGELISMPLREAREHFERAYLQAQLQRFGGNISRTANFVGMERSALHRKLKTLGLHGDD